VACKQADGGVGVECGEILTCFDDCIAAGADAGYDAGTAAACVPFCEAGHSPAAVMAFDSFATCITQQCSSQCQ
jgi:hypothetical protein